MSEDQEKAQGQAKVLNVNPLELLRAKVAQLDRRLLTTAELEGELQVGTVDATRLAVLEPDGRIHLLSTTAAELRALEEALTEIDWPAIAAEADLELSVELEAFGPPFGEGTIDLSEANLEAEIVRIAGLIDTQAARLAIPPSQLRPLHERAGTAVVPGDALQASIAHTVGSALRTLAPDLRSSAAVADADALADRVDPAADSVEGLAQDDVLGAGRTDEDVIGVVQSLE